MLSWIQSEACLTNLLVTTNLIKLTVRTHLCSNNVHNSICFVYETPKCLVILGYFSIIDILYTVLEEFPFQNQV